MRFIIYTPTYRKSKGVMVLYRLQQILTCYGQNAIIINFGCRFNVNKDDVVVYPEIIHGNPLDGSNVVRYLLNKPGEICNGPKSFSKDEMIFAYHRDYSQYSNGKLLYMPGYESFFTNNRQKRDLNCYWVGKGNFTDHSLTKKCLEITYHWPSERRMLAALLNRTEILYTYDNYTALSAEALLCGCKVVGIKDCEVVDVMLRSGVTTQDGNTKKDYNEIVSTWEYDLTEQLKYFIKTCIKSVERNCCSDKN